MLDECANALTHIEEIGEMMSSEFTPNNGKSRDVSDDATGETETTTAFGSSGLGGGNKKKWILPACVLFLVLALCGGLIQRNEAHREEQAEIQRIAEQQRLEKVARDAEAARIEQSARVAEALRLAEERRIAEARRFAEERRAAELQQHRTRLADLQREHDNMESEISRLDSSVDTYMSQHPEAVVAICAGIGGGSVALDPDNEYSDEARAIGGIAAVLAVIWASQNMDEVNAVVAELDRASEVRKGYQAQLSSLSSSILQEQASISQLESSPIYAG